MFEGRESQKVERTKNSAKYLPLRIWLINLFIATVYFKVL